MSLTQPPASFPPSDVSEREALTDWIESVPLVYGPWQGFKSGFKTLETAVVNGERAVEPLATLLSRLDAEAFPEHRRALAEGGTALATGSFSMLLAGEGVVYAFDSRTLRVYDANSPLEPRVLHEVESSGYALQKLGRFLLVGENLFDLSNPHEPRFFRALSLPYYQAIFGLGDEHFMVQEYGKISVYRLPQSESEVLSPLGTLEGFTNNLVVAGNVGVTLWGQNYYQRNPKPRVLDLSNPTHPKLGRELSAGNTPVAAGDDLLVFSDDKNLFFFRREMGDVSQAGRLPIPNARNVVLLGDLALVSSYDYRTYVHTHAFIDLSNPHDPRKVGEISNAHWNSIARVGDVLWLGNHDGLRVLDISDPARARFLGLKPSASTLGYLKRRGRRLLRTLADAQPEFGFELATQLLEQSSGEALDFTREWQRADVLVGNGHVFEQKRHGRGPIVQKPVFWRRRRLERAPQQWDANPSRVRELAQNENLPWQIVVTARRSLTVNGQEIPPLSPRQLEAVLWGDWAWASVEAAREAQIRSGELSPRALAGVLWIANSRRRRAILETTNLSVEVGSHLATRLGQNTPTEGGLTRRGREIALLLAARCDISNKKFDGSGALPALPALLGANEAPLRSLGLDLCRRLSPEAALEIVTFLPRLPQNVREQFVDALRESASKGRFDGEILAKLVRHSDVNVRNAVWTLIAASKTKTTVLRELWASLLRGLRQEYNYTSRRSEWQISSALQTALESLDALDVLAKSNVNRWDVARVSLFQIPASVFAAYSLFSEQRDIIDVWWRISDEIWNERKAAWLRIVPRHPKILASFWSAVQAALESQNLSAKDRETLRIRTFADAQIAGTFAGAASQLPPQLLLQLIGAVPDEVWNLWRPVLLEALQTNTTTRSAFWDAARTLGFENSLLKTRIADDEDFAATFGLLESDALEFDDPALENLLVSWLQARRETLPGDEFARAATHPLPDVRFWGLARLFERGLNVPLALRLLESDLPDAVSHGRRWFESQMDGANATNLALALCDSPHLPTRELGRELVTKRLETLVENGLLQKLEENPNAEMQAFVAALLLEKPEAPASEFDRAVLRSRYRARHAKNLVQKRRKTSAPLEDEATLLELARGRTPRDAEWALQQLARRAMNGETIEGAEVSGVGAI